MLEEETSAVEYHELFSIPKSELGKLTSGDRWWRDHQPWLAERGYMLHPRYHEGWVPSWPQQPDSSPYDYEDGMTPILCYTARGPRRGRLYGHVQED
ncbi:hypothetical protein BD413DRAFT_88044 [Trametes elegans]|nr:hypothetical protein BD413DRAFT_88044 [Trametes elegans]